MSAATGKSLIVEFYIFCIAPFIALHFCIMQNICNIENYKNNNI